MSGLQVKNLSTRLLSGVDFEVPPGSCLTIAGPSGSGKSLLLRAIADIDPHEGEVSIDDRDSNSMTGPQWRRMVAMMPAESQWWYESVGEHFPADAKTDFIALGFRDEVRGWNIDRLSTGERQRLSLLRTLALEPKALLLDEPTAALDEKSRKAVEVLIANYRRQHHVPVIWVSHDEEQIRRVSDMHMDISDGHLVDRGKAGEAGA